LTTQALPSKTALEVMLLLPAELPFLFWTSIWSLLEMEPYPSFCFGNGAKYVIFILLLLLKKKERTNKTKNSLIFTFKIYL
jgi:hypothetical protein